MCLVPLEVCLILPSSKSWASQAQGRLSDRLKVTQQASRVRIQTLGLTVPHSLWQSLGGGRLAQTCREQMARGCSSSQTQSTPIPGSRDLMSRSKVQPWAGARRRVKEQEPRGTPAPQKLSEQRPCTVFTQWSSVCWGEGELFLKTSSL